MVDSTRLQREGLILGAIGELERAFASVVYPNRLLIAILAALAVVALAALARRRRWDRAVRRHPRLAALGLVAALAVTLPVGWYLGSPLFITTTIDEAPPVAAADPTGTPAPSIAAQTPASPSAVPATAGTDPSPTPKPLLERTGTFHGADDFHFGRGRARLIETAPGSYTVRLEGFAVRNGPDLYVYLSSDRDGHTRDAIELGRLKADRGNQNYSVAPGTDVSRAASVVIWCKQFSVLFATAPLD